MTTTTKLTGLSGLQTRALQEAQEEGLLSDKVIVKKTTAEFPINAIDTYDDLVHLKVVLAAKYGSRQHPVASLHAVIRKAKAAMDS